MPTQIEQYRNLIQLNANIYSRQTMILGSQSISNQSQGFSDYRYHKALKEISKLINVNRQIKIQGQRYRCEIQEISQRNEQLLEINSKLQSQVQTLRNELRSINTSYIQLQNSCKAVECDKRQSIKSRQDQALQKLQIEHSHRLQMEQVQKEYKQKLSRLVSQMNEKDKKIIQLQQKVQFVCELQAQNNKLHQQYELTLRQNQQFHGKMSQMSEQLINVSTKIRLQPNQQLLSKLKINEEWINSLNEQNYNLKQKLLEDEYKKQRQKCNETIFRNMQDFKDFVNIPPSPSNQILLRQYSKKFQTKLKKIQEQKQKLEHKNSKLKLKCSQLQAQNSMFQKERNLLTIKINGYERLADRQQKQIQKMILQFNKQMDRVIKKKKTISFSHNNQQPSHNKQQPSSPTTKVISKQRELKALVQNLQTEISQNMSQAHQKDKLIHFLETKIQAMQQERTQLHKANQQLQKSLLSEKNSDLSKTSKVYNKPDNLLKTQPLLKNGGKVFFVSGNTHETKLLRHKDSAAAKRQQENSGLGINNSVSQPHKKVYFPTGQISYVSSQRNYDNYIQLNSTERA